MPKYFDFKIDDYYLYFTDKCIVEAFHVHASNKKMSEKGSAKFFVKADGSSIVKHKGRLSPHSISEIQRFIKKNYLKMYEMWREAGGEEFYGR